MQEISDAKIEYVAKRMCSANGDKPDSVFNGRPYWTWYEMEAIGAIRACNEFDTKEADNAAG